MKSSKLLPLLIKQINDAITKQINRGLKKADLTLIQAEVLGILNKSKNKSASLKTIENHLKVAQPTCVGIIKRLSQKDYIEYYSDPFDKRIKHIKLTTKGEECLKAGEEYLHLSCKKLFEGFSKEDKENLFNLLQKLYLNLN